VVTDQGNITIANGQTTGTLTIASGNGPDVYVDASSLTATIRSANGGTLEKMHIRTASATAQVTDTITPVTVNLSASTVNEDAADTSSVVTSTLSLHDALPISVVTDQGNITIANGDTTGTLTIASGNGPDVYVDASSLTA